MIHFRRNAEMFVPKPKQQLAHYTDLTMPRRNWRAFDLPLSERAFMAPRYRRAL